MSDPAGPELITGLAAYAARAIAMIGGARNDIALLSQVLDRRVYGDSDFDDALRRFVLQHPHTRVRILLHTPADARANSPRLVETGRALTTFIEFRELLDERRLGIREEYLIADGRALLQREDPRAIDARYDPSPLTSRLKLKDFDTLWNESPPAQELRRLGL